MSPQKCVCSENGHSWLSAAVAYVEKGSEEGQNNVLYSVSVVLTGREMVRNQDCTRVLTFSWGSGRSCVWEQLPRFNVLKQTTPQNNKYHFQWESNEYLIAELLDKKKSSCFRILAWRGTA